MTEKARFRYSAQDGVLELEGSEEFVSKHFEGLTDIVRVMARHTVVEQKADTHRTDFAETTAQDGGASLLGAATVAVSLVTQSSQAPSIADYPHVYADINGKLKIVSKIKGDSLRSRMSTIGMLYCYGAALMGDDQVTSKNIRDACEEHGSLDSKNFATIFDDKTIFISDGVKGGTKQIKLTHTGREKVKELLLNG